MPLFCQYETAFYDIVAIFSRVDIPSHIVSGWRQTIKSVMVFGLLDFSFVLLGIKIYLAVLFPL